MSRAPVAESWLRAVREATAADAADPLASLRKRFEMPFGDNGVERVYLCGHSLGLLPRDARRLIAEELDDWARLGVEGHHRARRPWIDYAELLRDDLALLAGARPAEVVAMNSLTVNLHLLMASFYRPEGRRRLIVIESGAFSSDRHAVVSQLQWHGLTEADALLEVAPAAGEDLIDLAQLEAVLRERSDEVALVLWPGVQYRTGQAFDLARVAQAAHAAGACCGFDLAHAMGNTPLSLHDAGADFAVWCGYKYLNGGPGALAGAFVHAHHDRAALPRLAGWWGHDPDTRFRMEPGFVPAPGAAGWQLSNPPILAAAPLLASLALFREAGLANLQAKAQSLGTMLERGLQALSTDLEIVTPLAPGSRGCQLSVRVRAGREAGRRLFAALEAQGIVADWREPDILRFAAVPLYNTHGDVALLLRALGDSLASAAAAAGSGT
ncbi:MAG: kynureninase [Pseudomonadota bacterium]